MAPGRPRLCEEQSGDHLHRSVVVAVVAVRVVQAAVDQEIGMVAVRDFDMSATVMVAGALDRVTPVRVGRAYRENVLVVVAVVGVVHVAVVKEIDVAFVLDARVAARLVVLVVVVVVDVMAHGLILHSVRSEADRNRVLDLGKQTPE